MSINSYDTLASSIASWMHRTDLTSVIPDFIRMAEARLQLDLDIRQLDKVGTITTVAGSYSAALPADFNGMRSMSMVTNGITIVLDHVPAALLRSTYGSYSSDVPRSYAIVGNTLLLGPTPNGIYSLDITYTSTIPALSPSNQTNDVLSVYPDAYLHCALIFAGQYVRDNELVSGIEALYAGDLARINAQNWGQMSTMTIKRG